MILSPIHSTPAYLRNGCKCRRHRLHRLFQFYWRFPGAKLKDAAKELKLTYGNVRNAAWALRKLDLSVTCPECMEPKLVNGVCQNCGFEPETPFLPFDILPDSQSPTNNLHPGNELGGETDYQRIGFTNHGLILKRLMERAIEGPLVKSVKSDVENELKRFYPSEAITDEAGRLVIKEVLELQARYPRLIASKYARSQIAENVIRRLRLLHPQLREVRALA